MSIEDVVKFLESEESVMESYVLLVKSKRILMWGMIHSTRK
jgi:hypothetical protein